MTENEAREIHKRNVKRLEHLKSLDYPYTVPLEWYLEVIDALQFMQKEACGATN